MAVPQVQSHEYKDNTCVVDSDITTDDTELDTQLDELSIEPIAPQKSEHARKVVAAYSKDADQCRDLLLMLGLLTEKTHD